MKKMKRLVAILLTMAMVLGMSLTAFAYDEIEIPIQDKGNGKFAALQLIKPDTTKDTGWAFTTTDIAEDFTSAFGLADGKDQDAIWMLIGNKNANVKLPENIKAATAGQIETALNNVKAGHKFNEHSATVKVNDAGVYYIDGVDVNEEGKENYIYSPMAAYVSFNYNETDVPTSLSCAGVIAKKAPTTTIKDVDDKDKVVEIGREVTYTVTSNIPYLPVTDSNRHYVYIDEIIGAEYSAEADKTTVNVTITGTSFNKNYETAISTTEDGKETFTLDLTNDILKADGKDVNTYANKEIIVTYKAVVKELHVHNDVFVGDGSANGKDRFGSDNEELWSGKITLTKYNEDKSKELAGAVFNVTRDDSTSKLYFKEMTADADGTRVYEFVIDPSKVDDETTDITTGTNGKLRVEGLEIKEAGLASTYSFHEIVAPEGYSINEESVSATLKLKEGQTEATAVLEAATSMKDTKLVALPSTGGIGTTIFTIVGCLIMVAAVGMFFVSRRRENI